jgi:predicted RNA-binding Zn-ribbon protein involved in translation (DUF1610 family)
MSAQNKKNYKVTPFTANKEDIGKICSICGSGILNDESIVTCPECGLPYHHECWKEMGGCGSYGCAAAPNIKKADYAPSDTYVKGWTSEKKCPECGAMIVSNAIICRVCKSKFPTEKPMTKEEWVNRIYDGNSLTFARITVLLQFIMSLFFFFSIFMFIINIYTLFLSDKLWWIYKMKRLTKELKILHYAGTVISGINLIIAIALWLSISGN